MRRRELLTRAALAGVLPAVSPAAGQARPALVAAAASVQGALDEIASDWMRSTGLRLAITYGASGNLVRQIQQGLPAELFLSADEEFALKLAEVGLARDQGVVYAAGRL